ncbi:deleted in malignant brain tumors 1 -like [Paramuricea clavata]|uniref:Deleted in malignant brain tumors 1 -like n=1 Tax=Paramuricea clavata TaxID=317549 RepID=A0A7D9DUF5_PARCT|nr:deleted in malignant brain tumors 1 -like [Paramuricea clavata]
MEICNSGKPIAIRLRGLPSFNYTTSISGRVEVFYSGKWGTICDDGWDMNDARVACRQLGYKYGVRALRRDSVPDGTGQIWLDDVACSGNELSLSSCPHNGWGNKNCGHSKDAGVECTSTGIVLLLDWLCEILPSWSLNCVCDFISP